MKIKYLGIFLISMILVFSVSVFGIITSIPASDVGKDNANAPENSPVIDDQWGLIDVGPVRVIAHTDEEVSSALARGCKVVRDAKTLKALTCSTNVAFLLGLQEDIRVFAMDSGANTQIKADLVQASGNNGSGRKVVVLDTGYNYNHQELSSSYLGGKDFVNNDIDPFDDNGHGSHVAGLITADGVDAKAKGVAPGTGVISGKVLSASGS